MKCVVSGANIKILAKAIHTLAKIGDEMFVQPQQNSLSFRTVNMPTSAYADFTFFENYFTYYLFGDLEEDDALKCKISMRSAMTVFKAMNIIDKQVETCHIKLESNADVLLFILKYKNSVTKTHLLPILDSERLKAAYAKDGLENQLLSQPRVLIDAVQNFQQNLIEITLEVSPEKVLLRNYVDDASNISNVTRTQLVLGTTEFDRYSINTNNTITFCFKELKAILNFADFVDVPVGIYFEAAGRPIIFVLKNPAFEVNLVLSTLNPDIDNQSETTVTSRTVKPQRKRIASKRSSKQSNKLSRKVNECTFIDNQVTSNSRPKSRNSSVVEGRQKCNDPSPARLVVNKKNIADPISNAEDKHEKQRTSLPSDDVIEKLSLNDLPSSSTISRYNVMPDNKKRIAETVFSTVSKRKSAESHTKMQDDCNVDDAVLENVVPNSPPPPLPPTKKTRIIFQKCFQTTFCQNMLPGHETVLAEDSDECNSE